ncbi:MAG: D-hexose-6-phosphate mutarotase [Gemmatimonadaceae bacterium]
MRENGNTPGTPGVSGSGEDAVTLVHSSGATARIMRHGAHIVSWVDPSGQERLYLSARARYGPGEAIRGGIPVIFPQFATGPLPKHGFLRTRRWSLVANLGDSATFRITDDEETRALWPHQFNAELTVELAEMLTVSLVIRNSGDSTFSFTAALHNYFAVTAVQQAAVEGLSGLVYVDKVAGGTRCVEEDADLHIHGETDRIYVSGPRQVSLSSAVGSSSTVIGADGFGDWVVWNPWRELSASLADMEPDDYLEMLCVEAARISDPVVLTPGATWSGTEVVGAT